MICKHCKKETSNVICDNCGINVVWYNKYGYIYDMDSPSEIDHYLEIMQDKIDTNIEDALKEIFVPDGSGD